MTTTIILRIKMKASTSQFNPISQHQNQRPRCVAALAKEPNSLPHSTQSICNQSCKQSSRVGADQRQNTRQHRPYPLATREIREAAAFFICSFIQTGVSQAS